MAGYRPKSLDELNKMYDQTMEAERAIKKGTSLLSGGESSAPTEQELDAIKQKEKELIAALESSYKFSDYLEKKAELASKSEAVTADEAPLQIEEPEIFTVEEAVIEEAAAPEEVFTQQEKIISEPVIIRIEETPEEEAVFTPEQDPPLQQPPVILEKIISEEFAAEQEELLSEPANQTAAEDKNSLFDDYMKIMNDEEEEDETPVKSKKFSRKEKKKMKKQKAAEKKLAEKNDEPSEASSEEEQDSEASESDGFSLSLSAEISINASDEEEAVEEAPAQTPSSNSFFTIEETVDEADEFSFPENYEPEWIGKDKAEDLMLEEESKKEKQKAKAKKEKKENKEKNTLGKAVLALLLAIVIALGVFATTLKSVIAVNTGTAFNGNFCAFTAYKTYENANILEGDLVITENVLPEDGDAFAYINYDEKIFDFAKRTKSFVNADDVLIVAVKENERVLISRDDCRGVVYATYPGIGTYVSMITDNYVILMAAFAVAAVVIILALIFGFRGEKADSKKKAVKKAAANDDDEDIFGSIN